MSTTYDKYCDADTYLDEPNPTTNRDGFLVNAGDAAGKTTNTLRALLKFDVSAISLGAGEEVLSVTIDIWVTGKTSSGAGADHGLYKLDSAAAGWAWVENQATWNVYSTGNAWAAAGGDYLTSSPYTFTPPAVSSGAYRTLASDANLVALVQDAIDNEAGIINLLWKEIDESDTTNQTQEQWRSSEYVTVTNRPIIHVTYGVPDVGQPALKRSDHVPHMALGNSAVRRRY